MLKTINAFFSLRAAYVVVLVLLCALTPCVSFAAQSIQESKSQVKQLHKVLLRLQKDLKAERSKRSKEERAFQKNEQDIAKLAPSISAIDRQLKKLQQNLNGYLGNRDRIAAQLEVQKQHLLVLLKQRYQMGEQTPLKLLLNQKDPEKMSRMSIYLDRIRQQQSEQVIAFRQLLVKHDTNNVKIDSTQLTLVAEKKSLLLRQAKLELTRVQRKKNLQLIERKISKNNLKMKQVAADKKRLERVISRIQTVISAPKVVKIANPTKVINESLPIMNSPARVIDNRPFKNLKGKLKWPVKGKIVRRFGALENNLSYDGVLIRAKQSSAVRAVHTGKIVFANWLRSYGMLMIVDHGRGYLTLYGHNDQLNKKVGDTVFPGEVIALVGSSGGNTRAGLYFAVRRDGQTTNPLGWLTKR